MRSVYVMNLKSTAHVIDVEQLCIDNDRVLRHTVENFSRNELDCAVVTFTSVLLYQEYFNISRFLLAFSYVRQSFSIANDQYLSDAHPSCAHSQVFRVRTLYNLELYVF